jgi:predicted acetyltransferase
MGISLLSIKATTIIVMLLIMMSGTSFTSAQNYTELSEQFFTAVKNDNKGAAEKAAKELAGIPEGKLKDHLNTENKAKAFWINIYNTYVQYLLKANSELFNDRNALFKDEVITLAGEKLSLDDIEHGIIRHSKNKYSMGYVGKVFVSDFEKRFRLDKVDYRIHFALNCGAKSCPPVALYKAERLDDQLNRSTSLYLNQVSKYDVKENVVSAPALCSWFKADFGGEAGVLKMMKEFDIVPEDKDPDVEYLDYDWTLFLSNYVDL